MTAEQLQTVRADRWRQKSNPVLTLEDAAAWINANGLCLFLPRRHQFVTPAPSFVEACAGAPSETPVPPVIENARSLMIRLANDGTILPLNLFGTHSDQPDFLASREAFPYIFTMRGGRNWKTPPPKASPLATETWKLLEPGVSLEVTEIQAALGREITEAAVLRSLMDLWGGLRALPVYEQDGPTRWELTQRRFSDALNAANKIAQTTGLSALVSLYLESVLAATPDEIEIFLSPLTSRSKIREVVNGLAATRQLVIVPVGTQTMYHVAGSLPEFAEPEPVAPSEVVTLPSFDRNRPSRDARGPARGPTRGPARGQERRPPFGRDRAGERPRTGPSRERFAATGSDRPRPRPAGSARPGGPGSSGGGRPLRTGTDARGNYPPRRKQFGAKASGPPRPRGEGDRPQYRKSEEGKQPGNYPRKAEDASGERKFPKRPFGQRPFNKPAGPGKPSGTRSAEDRPRFDPRGGKFPPKKFGKSKFDSGKPRPWKSGEPQPPRSEGAEGRPFRPRTEGASGRPRKPRPYTATAGEKRPFFRNKPSRPGGKPEGKVSDRSGAAEKSGPSQRGWKPKPSGFSRSAKPPFGKPKFGAARPSGSKSGGSSFGGKKFGSGGKKFGGPPSRGKSAGARPDFKSGAKPGGVKPPFRKRKDKGDAGKSSE